MSKLVKTRKNPSNPRRLMFTDLQKELDSIEQTLEEEMEDLKNLFSNDMYYLSINVLRNETLCIRYITTNKNFKYVYLDSKFLRQILNYLYKFVNLKYFEFIPFTPVDINLIMSEVTIGPSLKFLFVPEAFTNAHLFNGYVFTRECIHCGKYNLFGSYSEKYDMIQCIDCYDSSCDSGFISSLDAFMKFEKDERVKIMSKPSKPRDDVDELVSMLMDM